MKMTAAVEDKQTGERLSITRDWDMTKKEFRTEMNRNGYQVIGRVYCDGDENTKDGRRHWIHGIK